MGFLTGLFFQLAVPLLELLLLVASMVFGAQDLSLGEVDNKFPAIRRFATQDLLSGRRGRLINKVYVSESTRQTGTAVNGDANIRHTLDVLENPLEIHIRQLVGNISNVKRLSGLDLVAGGLVGSVGVIYDDLATFKDTTILLSDSVGGFIDGTVCDVTKAGMC